MARGRFKVSWAVAIGLAGAAFLCAPQAANAQQNYNMGDRPRITADTPSFTAIQYYIVDPIFYALLHAIHYRAQAIAYAYGIGGFPWALLYPGGADGYREFGKGMAAGGAFPDDVTLWTSGSFTSSEDDFPGTSFDSKTGSVSFGGDIKIEDWVTAGAFVSLSDTDTDTAFNFGGADTKGISFGPYISGTLNKFMYVDMSVGVSLLDVSNHRIAPGTTLVITGDQYARSVFAAANLNASHWMGNLGLSGRVGISGSKTTNDDYTDSTGVLIGGSGSGQAQVQIEGQVSYLVKIALPFLKVTYNRDVLSSDIATPIGTPQPANDKDEVVVAAGVNVFGLGPFSASASFSKTFARENFDSWTASGQISYKFGGK